jgi:AcrR family transcriptional regulator
MADAVKRRYRSNRRAAQARETRGRILDAAYGQLVEHGYHTTSIETIASQAGVAPQTVYNAFGTKRAILGALIRRAVRGDEDDPLPLAQPGGDAIRAEPDLRVQLRIFAEDISRRLARVAPLIELLNAAAPADPELGVLLTTIHRQRLGQLRKLAGWIGADASLKVSSAAAADTMWLLVSAEVYQLATTKRGWSRRRYARWLADSLAALLID